MGKKNNSKWIAGCKERGEWAELCFMARAKGLGRGVLKPYGESGRYDVAVENGGPILRVQVKSTIYCRRGNEYSLNVHGPGRKRYKKGTVDFFAVWVIPVAEWYIIPYAAMGKKQALHFTAGSKRAKWARYREAWDLLRVIEIQACVDLEYAEEQVGLRSKVNGDQNPHPFGFAQGRLSREVREKGGAPILFVPDTFLGRWLF